MRNCWQCGGGGKRKLDNEFEQFHYIDKDGKMQHKFITDEHGRFIPMYGLCLACQGRGYIPRKKRGTRSGKKRFVKKAEKSMQASNSTAG